MSFQTETTIPLSARVGAVFFALWGIAHIAGGLLQLVTLSSGGGDALAAMVASALSAPTDGWHVATPVAAFMGMGAWNIVWIGALVTYLAATGNWRNRRGAYLLNMTVVAAVDAGLVVAMLAPGYMSWGDGAVGLVLFAIAAACSSAAQIGGGRASRAADAFAR